MPTIVQQIPPLKRSLPQPQSKVAEPSVTDRDFKKTLTVERHKAQQKRTAPAGEPEAKQAQKPTKAKPAGKQRKNGASDAADADNAEPTRPDTAQAKPVPEISDETSEQAEGRSPDAHEAAVQVADEAADPVAQSLAGASAVPAAATPTPAVPTSGDDGDAATNKPAAEMTSTARAIVTPLQAKPAATVEKVEQQAPGAGTVPQDQSSEDAKPTEDDAPAASPSAGQTDPASTTQASASATPAAMQPAAIKPLKPAQVAAPDDQSVAVANQAPRDVSTAVADVPVAEIPDAAEIAADEPDIAFKAKPDAKDDAPYAEAGQNVSELSPTSRGAAAHQAPASPAPPEVHFAEQNLQNVITSVRTQLLPHGGTMQIRLDPPELGALQVTLHVNDGQMTASFQTTNDEATRLLSHSLNQLRQALETQGVHVEKIQVQQTSKDFQHGGEDSRQQHPDDASARQEQQRREMLKRMWARLRGADAIDFLG